MQEVTATRRLGRHRIRVLPASILIAASLHSAIGQTDCSLRAPLSKLSRELARGCPTGEKTSKCLPIGTQMQTNSISKIDIRKPGHYCLTEDLHTRIEFGDQPAEGALIVIWVSDVMLDLQGHTLGRGRLFKNPGGNGIEIVDQFLGPSWVADTRNIVIANGILRDFETAIYHDSSKYPAEDERPIYDKHTNTYRFKNNNIVLENVTFENNRRNFQIRIPLE